MPVRRGCRRDGCGLSRVSLLIRAVTPARPRGCWSARALTWQTPPRASVTGEERELDGCYPCDGRRDRSVRRETDNVGVLHAKSVIDARWYGTRHALRVWPRHDRSGYAKQRIHV